MIPIHFKKPEDDIIENLYNKLGLIKMGKGKKKELKKAPKAIDDWCRLNIQIDGYSYSFEEIIKADFNTLTCIKKKIDDNNLSLPIDLKKYMLDTLYKRYFPRQEFVDALEITVCPYCNRNFVNSAYYRTMCELDHFYEKSDYPILAVSFYNLVPVCHNCNHVKGTKNISYSPHDGRFKTDELLTFDFHITGMDFLHDKQQLGIEIYDTNEIKGNIDILKLREVYQIHTDVVQECIKRAIVFEPSYINYLANEYQDLFDSTEEMYRIIFGNYYKEDTYGKRPLAKMSSDIIRDLIMLCYAIDLRQ